MVQSPLIRVIKGRIHTDVHVFLDKLFHVVRVKNVPGVDGLAVEVRIAQGCTDCTSRQSPESVWTENCDPSVKSDE